MQRKKISVIGSGYLGTQIAMLTAYTGYEVKVFDSREGALRETFEMIRSDLQDKGIEPVIPWEQWETCAKAIRQVEDMGETIREAELIIESVPENLELKKEVFQEIGQKAQPGAILATNSSSIPVSRLESSSGHPEYCLNIHFYYPLQGINMVEIMGGTRTSPEVMENGITWIRSLGSIPLTVKKECLGFCLKKRFTQKRETIGQPIHKISYLNHGSVKNPGCEGQDFLIGPFLIQIVDRSGSQRRKGVD